MTYKINFKFEHFLYDDCLNLQSNLYSGKIFNFSKEPPYRFSQVVESMLVCNEVLDNSSESLTLISYNESVDHYIISTAVYYSNEDWTKYGTTSITLFEELTPKYLNDLKNRKALLLIDQSVEGYQRPWLWQWFHDKCNQHEIDPSCIIYLTGNQAAEVQYNKWYEQQELLSKIKVIPSISLSFYIYQSYYRSQLNIQFDEILKYRQNNLSNIKLYDCINLRFRFHRILNFLHLVNSELLSLGKVSMGDKKNWPVINNEQLIQYKLPITVRNKLEGITPMWIDDNDPNDGEYHVYITRILDQMYKDTWVSLVVESTYFDYEDSIFISEKTFKPIACMQPFIIVGSKHSLRYIRRLGYKTFDGFIDESYDELDDDERIAAIIDSLKKIQNIEDKISWYNSMKEILEHNHRLFLSIGTQKFPEHSEISKYYLEYFFKP